MKKYAARHKNGTLGLFYGMPERGTDGFWHGTLLEQLPDVEAFKNATWEGEPVVVEFKD